MSDRDPVLLAQDGRKWQWLLLSLFSNILYLSYDSLVSKDDDADCFPSLSLNAKVLPYQFEPYASS